MVQCTDAPIDSPEEPIGQDMQSNHDHNSEKLIDVHWITSQSSLLFVRFAVMFLENEFRSRKHRIVESAGTLPCGYTHLPLKSDCNHLPF